MKYFVPVFLCLLSHSATQGQGANKDSVEYYVEWAQERPTISRSYQWQDQFEEQWEVFFNYTTFDEQIVRVSFLHWNQDVVTHKMEFYFHPENGKCVLKRNVGLKEGLTTYAEEWYINGYNPFHYRQLEGADEKVVEERAVSEWEGDDMFFPDVASLDHVFKTAIKFDHLITLDQFKYNDWGHIAGTAKPKVSNIGPPPKKRYDYNYGDQVLVEVFDDTESPDLRIINGHLDGMMDQFRISTTTDWEFKGVAGNTVFLVQSGAGENSNVKIFTEGNTGPRYEGAARELMVRDNYLYILKPLGKEEAEQYRDRLDCSQVPETFVREVCGVYVMDMRSNEPPKRTNQHFCLGEM